MMPHPSRARLVKLTHPHRRVQSMTTPIAVGVLLGVMAATAPVAHGRRFDCRFIERIGNQNVLLPGYVVDAPSGLPRNIRVPLGVFDDKSGPAPQVVSLAGFPRRCS